MKFKKLKFYPTKFWAFLTAMGITFTSIPAVINCVNNSKSNTASAEEEKEPKNTPYTYYYTIGDMTFVSNGEVIGYIYNDGIDFSNIEIENYNVEFSDMFVNTDNVGVYLLPGFENECKQILMTGESVTLNAFNDDWAVVNYHNNNGETRIGFVHKSFLSKTNPLINESVVTPEPIDETKVGVVTGNNVNIRSSMKIDSTNIINICNEGDLFVAIKDYGEWIAINYYGQEAYISSKYFKVEEKKEDLSSTIPATEVVVAKITGNNVNVRSSASTSNSNNIIGFCDMTDKFEIISREGDWYYIKYLNTTGYVHSKYVKEKTIDSSELSVKKMVALKTYSPFYSDTNGNTLCYLPENQNVLVLGKVGNYYKVRVDGVVGYVNIYDTKALTNTCLVVDLSRQIVKLNKDGIELFRCHTITGKESTKTEMGCFEIGHHMEDYTFTNKNIRNEYWIQYDGNRGFHPADSNYGKGWQPESHFVDVAKSAYSHWAKGEGRTYPDSYGSNGCVNMMLKDIAVLYGLCDVGDNVLVIGPNDLIKNNLLSSTNNFTFAFDDNDNLYVIGRDKEIVMVIESIDQDTKKVKPKEYNFNPDAMDDKQKVKTLSNV